eukprot:CAMPEP_0184669332 /NCGR_PEP_ID=MMETSP0308-20130426/76813_1 /TAXON_ID=38269 /ORGANISM="Gloeochaete witrockiana, Strain SAG 46.84" /LENGTH=52 /DNA_ID=CAMNT_0027115539 /DNA_START=41 /DNA_END=199 /DNA_ORIENTATION=+
MTICIFFKLHISCLSSPLLFTTFEGLYDTELSPFHTKQLTEAAEAVKTDSVA